MLIVIDTNVLCSTFDERNNKHSEFRPVLQQIRCNKAKMVYGGSTYNRELARLTKIRRLILELSRSRRVQEICCSEVDKEEKKVKRNIHQSFNDHHIIAIVIVGRCNCICSCDKRAHRFFKVRNLYPSNMPVPKIYSGLSSARRWRW